MVLCGGSPLSSMYVVIGSQEPPEVVAHLQSQQHPTELRKRWLSSSSSCLKQACRTAQKDHDQERGSVVKVSYDRNSNE
jgi:hypothetical protein